MKIFITDAEIKDIRFPTSLQLDGSDAMNPDPDYSAAYVILKTNRKDLQGHGLTFTIGRGNEICAAAIQSILPLVIGKDLDSIKADMAGFWRHVTGDSQLRWLGPEKGVIHLATGAIINAVWDLWAKEERKPLWQLVSDMSPESFIQCVDFSYITDVITPDEALKMLRSKADTKPERIKHLKDHGYPAYTTSAGWLGYSEEKIRRLCREAINNGWRYIKMKVGSNIVNDMQRARIIRDEIGTEVKLMMDANQKWDVKTAIESMKKLSEFDPHWIEEPTSPDDVLGHAAVRKAISPVKVATGEHCQNRIMFKQFLQAGAIDFCQIDSCRVGGVNEILAILLMAAKFGVPVCPHAGGVGLSEHVQHLAMIDFICISGSLENRVIEYVDHLHEHFEDPVIIRRGCYVLPQKPGYSIEMRPDSLRDYLFPSGKIWKDLQSDRKVGSRVA
jgi:L-fuconate dehydratase